MILKKSISVFLSLLLVLSAVSLSHAIAEDGYATIEAAGTYLRERIKAHDAEIRLTYLGKTSDISETYFTDLIDLILDEAFRHTGVPDEGSYIHSHHEAVNTSLSAQIAGDVCIVYLTFGIEYRTTLEQEAETTAKLLEVRKELGLDGKNDYEKVLAIHDYIIDHVTYDYEHVDDENYLPQFTACAALLDGVAVCQGYATLMYRMLLAEGIDCRFVTGYANGGPHGWNIVKLGDYYYNVDATFDDGEGMDRYECFLKCEKSFSDHLPDPEFQTDEFRTAYPISPTDYSGDGTELPENPGIIAEPTTAEPTTEEPTTEEPTTEEPTTEEPTTEEPTTEEPTTAEPTTAEPTTEEPTTEEPTTAEPTTAEPTTEEPTTAEPTTAEPTTAEPTTAEPTTREPMTTEPTTAEPTTTEPTTAEPTTEEPTTTEPTTELPDDKTYYYGDVDLDGKIKAGDARRILRHAAKVELLTDAFALKLADLDHNGKVNAADARRALRAASRVDPTQKYNDAGSAAAASPATAALRRKESATKVKSVFRR